MSFWDGQYWTAVPTARTPQPIPRSKSRIVMTMMLAGCTLLAAHSARGAVATLTFDPLSATTGTTVGASASGLPPSTWVQLTWDGKTTGMPKARTSKRGLLSTNFVVPTAAAGTHQVTAAALPSRGGKTTVTLQSTLAAAPFVVAVSTSSTPQPTPSPSATPTPVQPTPSPTPNTADWTLVLDDQFTTFNSSLYFQYADTWRDTSGNGRYGAPITSDGSKLRIYLHTDSTGPRVAAFVPQPGGGTGDHLGWRYQFRMRADFMPGYKGVPLLWPKSGMWPQDGEINWPEGGFDHLQPVAYMHRQDATCGCDQDVFFSPPGTSWQDWHVYEVRWVPDRFAEFYLDGVLIGRSTNRIPRTAMHLVMQFETNLDGFVPHPSVSGYVEIDYLKMWKLH